MGVSRLFKAVASRAHRRAKNSPDSRCKLIVGLGNPGREYKGTRHNIGFEVLDLLAGRLEVSIKKKKFGALAGEARHAEKKLILLKPQEYMNRSGRAVATAAGFYRLAADDLLVVTDDMALPAGRIRIRPAGGAGGHNGLADIIAALGTDGFPRLRVGVGKPSRQPARDYVLARPGEEERGLLDQAAQRAADAVLCWLETGTDAAMNKFNAADEEKQ